MVGCRFLGEDDAETTVVARSTLLATGGAGQVFAETTNPPVATGDGVAMGLRAGAALLDMEFVQFHPTALAIPGAPRFLVSEAVRGEGARLLNAALERFTDELLSRDQVARAIFREERAGRGPVVLDLRHLDPERVRTRFPRIHATCLRFGLDITRDPVPVTPAAHYVMGGVATDLHGRTTLPGLYAAGEAAGTGVHGANRLASNSLLEGLVFGARAAEAMAADANPAPDSALAEARGPASAATNRASGEGTREPGRPPADGTGAVWAWSATPEGCGSFSGSWLRFETLRLPVPRAAPRPRTETFPTWPGPWPPPRSSARRAGGATSAPTFRIPTNGTSRGIPGSTPPACGSPRSTSRCEPRSGADAAPVDRRQRRLPCGRSGGSAGGPVDVPGRPLLGVRHRLGRRGQRSSS